MVSDASPGTPPPQDEWILHSYGACVFRLCMRTGWVLETSPSDHYWWRYEVGQWLVFGWLGGWGTSDTRLARRKLGKNNTLQSWRPPLPYGHHGALPPALPHTKISQHAARQVYVVKTREKYCFYYLLAILRHDASLTRHACVFAPYTQRRSWEHHTLSAARWEYDTLSAVWSCYYIFMLIAAATKKTTIGDTDDCWFTTIVNSVSTAAPIGLPPKMAKFCHTFNRLLVGRWRCRALLQLYFNSSAVGCRSVQNKGSRALQ